MSDRVAALQTRSVLVAASAPASSTPEAAALALQAEHDAVQKLAAELRCLVCQNQTIADSNATLAVDLRKVIQEQLRAGKDEAAIKQYMVERYGEFILYDPPFSAGNMALWIGPFLLLVIAGWIALRVARRGRLPSAKVGDAAEPLPLNAQRLQALEERYRRDTGKM